MNVNSVIVERLAAELVKRDAQITTAESCTGGWVAKTLTDFPGSSVWFGYGFVSYSDAAKQTLLDVPDNTIAEHGAVSRETAEAMVTGALANSDANFGLAVTGIAGPTGGTPEKPAGTVCFAWGARGEAPVSRCQHFDGDRDTVRRQTVTTALTGALDLVTRR